MAISSFIEKLADGNIHLSSRHLFAWAEIGVVKHFCCVVPTFLLLSALRKIRYRLLNLNQIFDSSEVAIAIYPTVQGQVFFLRLLATHVSISEVDFDARCVWFEEINGEHLYHRHRVLLKEIWKHAKCLEVVESSARSSLDSFNNSMPGRWRLRCISPQELRKKLGFRYSITIRLDAKSIERSSQSPASVDCSRL